MLCTPIPPVGGGSRTRLLVRPDSNHLVMRVAVNVAVVLNIKPTYQFAMEANFVF